MKYEHFYVESNKQFTYIYFRFVSFLVMFVYELQTKDGQILEAPRRLLIECPHWAARSSLALRILHAWAKEPPWPTRGTPVALALFIPLAELNHKKTFAHFVEKVRKQLLYLLTEIAIGPYKT